MGRFRSAASYVRHQAAVLRLDEAELADTPNIHLYPGMPATVMIPTVRRTAFDYVVGRLIMSLNHAFRRK